MKGCVIMTNETNPLLDYLKQEHTLEKYKHLSPNATNMLFTKSRIDITHFGKLFYEICVK